MHADVVRALELVLEVVVTVVEMRQSPKLTRQIWGQVTHVQVVFVALNSCF